MKSGIRRQGGMGGSLISKIRRTLFYDLQLKEKHEASGKALYYLPNNEALEEVRGLQTRER